MKRIKTNLGIQLSRNEMKQIQGGAKRRPPAYLYKCSGGAAFCAYTTCGHAGCTAVATCTTPSC